MFSKKFTHLVLFILTGIVDRWLARADSSFPDSNGIHNATTEDPSFDHADSNILSESRHAPAPCFDFTQALDARNASQIEPMTKLTRCVYYSTNRLLTEVSDLSWIVTTLEPYYPNKTITGDTSYCLVLAFQMTRNRSDIDWRHIEDILYTSLPQSDAKVHILKRHLCGVLLDFQLNDSRTARRSLEYMRQWNLSFTKYARMIMDTIFQDSGRKISVGLLYNEKQAKPDCELTQILLDQEIQHAPHVILNIDFGPLSTPLLLRHEQFEDDYLGSIVKRNHMFLTKNETRPNIAMLQLMGTWGNASFSAEYSGLEWFGNMMKSTAPEYLSRFTSLMGPLENVTIISGTTIDFRKMTDSRRNLDLKQILPYLYIHGADVTSCQLKTMLGQTGILFDTLVVNEYTWSAIAKYEESLIEVTSPCNSPIEDDEKYPETIVLMLSQGFHTYWNKSMGSFVRFIHEHNNAATMNLATVVFSFQDLYPNEGPYYNQHHYHSPTPLHSLIDFANLLQRNNIASVGCSMDLSWQRFRTPFSLVDATTRYCPPSFLRNSSLIVWRQPVKDRLDLNGNFVGNLEETFKEHLPVMKMAEQMLKEKYPDIKVAVHMEVQMGYEIRVGNYSRWIDRENNENMFMKNTNESLCLKLRQRQFTIECMVVSWTNIHNLKVMVKPVYDFKTPSNGMMLPPTVSGKRVFDSDGCSL